MWNASPAGPSDTRYHGGPGCVTGISIAWRSSSVAGSDISAATDGGGVVVSRLASGGGDGKGDMSVNPSSDVTQPSVRGARNWARGHPASERGAGRGDTGGCIGSGRGDTLGSIVSMRGADSTIGGYCNSGVGDLTGSSWYTGSPLRLSSNARGLSSRVGNMSRYRTRRVYGRMSGVLEHDRTVRREGDREEKARGDVSTPEFPFIRMVLIANGS